MIACPLVFFLFLSNDVSLNQSPATAQAYEPLDATILIVPKQSTIKKFKAKHPSLALDGMPRLNPCKPSWVANTNNLRVVPADQLL